MDGVCPEPVGFSESAGGSRNPFGPGDFLFYFGEAGDRRKQKHYQAWQVINAGQGKGDSGARIEALAERSEDHQPLVGIDALGAFLQEVRLARGANLLRCNRRATDLRDSRLSVANLEYADLRSAIFTKRGSLTWALGSFFFMR
jgi:hypothetical protein